MMDVLVIEDPLTALFLFGPVKKGFDIEPEVPEELANIFKEEGYTQCGCYDNLDEITSTSRINI